MGTRGHLITFEGIDGAGKSTQLDRLAVALRALGHLIVTSREPGGTPLGQELRRLVLEHESDLSPGAELHLFLSDRSEHVARVLRPALEAGAIVLCDRFSDSTIAYQGYGRQADLDRIRRYDRESRGGIDPDLTLWLDCSVEEGLRRRTRSGDRFESLDRTFHERVRNGFRAEAAAAPDRIRTISSQHPIEQVASDISALVLEWLRTRDIEPPR